MDDTSLRPRFGETAEQTVNRVIDAVRRKQLKLAIDQARRSQIPRNRPHTPGSHTRTPDGKEQP
jgi:hypothetical protein